MKNYYKILGVTPSSSEDEIRKNYRQLAMRYHPDRNPDDHEAEEKFKNIAEAYGVLTDPDKRKEYDRCRQKGTTYKNTNSGPGFSYSQEDILKDLFKDPRFQSLFSKLLREFQRSGFRHSPQFVKRSFFGGKANIFLGGIFLFGSIARPLLTGAARKSLSSNSGVMKKVTNSISSLLKKNKKVPLHPHSENLDIIYHTPATEFELKYGKNVRVVVYGNTGEQTLKVMIPAGSKNGQKLRIRGKGRPGPKGRGDLYLHLVQKE